MREFVRACSKDNRRLAIRAQFSVLLYLLLLVLLLPCTIQAASVWRELEHIPDTLSVSQLETTIPVQVTLADDTLGVRDTITQLLDRQSKDGWWSARFDSLVQQGEKYVIHISRGQQFQLVGMQFDNSSNLQSVLASSEPASEGAIVSQLYEEMAAWQDAGSAFAEISLERVLVQNGDVSLDWKVRHEAPVKLSRQLVNGNQVTRPGVIQRLTRFRKDMVYSPAHWEKARRNLQRRIFISDVDQIRLVRCGEEEYACLVSLTEAPSYFFAGNLGFSGGEAEAGFWVWNLDIRLLNILGTARELYLLTDRTAPSTRSISVRYREPFVLGTQLFLEPHLLQQDHDSTYHERQYGITAGWRPTFTLELTSGLSRQEVFPDSLHGWVEQGIRQERNTVWRSTVRYDSRDDLLHPRSGVMASYSFVEKYKRLHPPGETESQGHRVVLHEAYAQQPVRLLRYWTLLLEEQGQMLQSDSTISVTDLLRVGGARSLRGYREEQFLVDSFLMGRAELRRQLGRGSDLHLFMDGAFLERRGVVRRETGYGIGLKLRIRQGYLGVDYALPGDGGPGDGKLHILYESLF